jgi:hypothetical protein
MPIVILFQKPKKGERMSINWFEEENASQGELIAPPPLDAPPAAKAPVKGRRGRSKTKIETPSLSAPPIPPPAIPAQEETKEVSAPEIPPNLYPTPNVPPPPLEIPPLEAEAPPLPPAAKKGPNDDIPDFAPPPSMLKEKKEERRFDGDVEELYGIPKLEGGMSSAPMGAPVVHPSTTTIPAYFPPAEEIPAHQDPDTTLLNLSKKTNIEVYKYPEKLLLEVPLDISVVKPRFIEAIRKVELMCKMVDEAAIKTEDDAKKLTGLLADIKRLEELIDDARLKLTKPYRESASSVNGFANEFTEKLEVYFKRGKSKVQIWTQLKQAEDIKRRLKEKKAADEINEGFRIEANEETKRNREEAVKQGLDPSLVPAVPAPQLPVPVPEKASGKIRTEGATAYVKEEIVCEVVIAADVPREYCVPSQKLLDQAVSSGVRAIGGCNIYPKAGIGIRKK